MENSRNAIFDGDLGVTPAVVSQKHRLGNPPKSPSGDSIENPFW